MARRGIDSPAIIRAIDQLPESREVTRLGEFVEETLDDDVGGALKFLRGMGVADEAVARGHASNVWGASGEWVAENLRRSEGWDFIQPRSAVHAAGYNLVLETGGVVRVVEVKTARRLDISSLSKYFFKDDLGTWKFHADVFRDELLGPLVQPAVRQAFDTGNLEVEIMVNGNTSDAIASSIAAQLGRPTRIQYLDDAGNTHFISAILNPINQ